MKLTAAISFLVAASIVSAAPSERDVVLTYNGLPGSFAFSFGDCIPFRMDGAPANTGQVNKLAKCYLYSDGNCLDQVSPAYLLVPPGINFVNAADFVEAGGESGKCFEFE